ncbi:MAG: hypothetical protein KGM16_19590 [Bacteroidota bacterium]|nr:hypothetical protein [Bacteroidota bacterium]
MESIREIVIPENNKIELTIPDHFIGKKIEVLAFELEEKQKVSRDPRKKSFDAITLDLTGFKFNREEANER